MQHILNIIEATTLQIPTGIPNLGRQNDVDHFPYSKRNIDGTYKHTLTLLTTKIWSINEI
jgi:hypothetical protein